MASMLGMRRYTAPFGLMALYSHPVEHLISNLWAFLGVMSRTWTLESGGLWNVIFSAGRYRG